VAWRTNQSNVSFDNVRVTGSSASYNTLVYLHGDHLGSVGAVTSSGGALLDMTRFLPFGGYRGSDPAFLTERGFTGHRMNNTATNDLGLIYMNARYYVGSIGRFASADTLVPAQNDPQALNRYAYARNNPLLIVDPSGHCWGVASGIRNWNFTIGGTTYGGGVNCANIDMALTIVQHPDATPTEKAQAGVYLGGWGVAAISGGAGTGLLACSTVAPCAAAAKTALGIGTAISADGNPTNEAQLLQGVVDRGFGGNHELYKQFMQQLRSALPSGTRIGVRGSSLTGQSWKTGRSFDALGPGTSDLDMVLTWKTSYVTMVCECLLYSWH
jgi:RHS repeat-associated protein